MKVSFGKNCRQLMPVTKLQGRTKWVPITKQRAFTLSQETEGKNIPASLECQPVSTWLPNMTTSPQQSHLQKFSRFLLHDFLALFFIRIETALDVLCSIGHRNLSVKLGLMVYACNPRG